VAEDAAADLARELFAPLGPVRVRRMFGGAGVHVGEAMLALIADGTLYMKADGALAADYAAAGSTPFTYAGGAKPVTMSYWRLPDAALDDADLALGWARRSLAVAEAAARARAARKPRAPSRAPRGRV
jgi:DNA transformation protein